MACVLCEEGREGGWEGMFGGWEGGEGVERGETRRKKGREGGQGDRVFVCEF